LKIYLAGYGHQIEKTPFVKELEKDWHCLLSYYFFSPKNVDKGMMNRFDYICKKKKQIREQKGRS